ncbi:hypothetical protein COR50_21915 [Chitinophaga caeni]|uniref:Mucoidy inhibitor MuiA family protein n=1 Tax=Chitinophaga caeni TaxID=2029983 RepID=A0A291R090_9BACT|nr:DUF4139 domain-containing protein [Chitinophaga caeni]ATL49617.1 hypothetical protein COR50_21915 [Chitinophaga caeni]
MKKQLSFLSALIICISTIYPSYGIGDEKEKIASKISDVTVFLNGAQVTRTAKISLQAGITVLQFPKIAADIDEKSLQIDGIGDFTVISVAKEKDYLTSGDKRVEIDLLNNKIFQATKNINEKMAQLSVFEAEGKILDANIQIGKGDNKAGETTIRDLALMLEFQRNRRTEIIEKQLKIKNQIQTLDSVKTKYQQQLSSLHTAPSATTNTLLIKISTQQAVQGNITLKYFVKNAHWYPTYDLKVNSLSQPIDLIYRANVHQLTGEDWNGVKLHLSTTNPDDNNNIPKLDPWYTNLYNSEYQLRLVQEARSGEHEVKGIVTDKNGAPIVGATLLVKGRSIGTVTDASGRFSLKIDPTGITLVVSAVGYEMQEIQPNQSNTIIRMIESSLALDEVVVTGYGNQSGLQGKVAGLQIRGASSVKMKKEAPPAPNLVVETKMNYQPTSVTYDITMPYTVASGDAPISVNINQVAVPATYEYISIPKKDKNAYLTASIIDWDQLNLLEGEANIYIDGSFRGKTLLNLANVGDTLVLSLGSDKNIQVNRVQQKEFNKRQFIGNNKTEYKSFEFSIRNLKKEAVKIKLLDQLPIPISNNVELIKPKYEHARLDENTQILTWELEVQPGKEHKEYLQFGIKLPKDKLINYL